MVARRIELRTSRSEPLVEASDVESVVKILKPEGKKIGQMSTWIIYILIGLVVYHCYDAYSEQIKTEEIEMKEGMDCLMQFKTSECNPLKLSDSCIELVECIQKSEKNINEVEIVSEMVKRTSRSLS
jgi:hypothetical protein